MAESPEQKYERLKHDVQEHILRDYPNPERKGCPGDAAIRSVASRTELRKDAWWHHVTHCSPCYQEFLDERRRLESAVAERRGFSRRRIIVGGGAVALATVSVLLVRGLRPDPVYQVSWDLASQRTFRGLDTEHMQGPTGPPLSAPAQRISVELKLPAGRTDGVYEVAIWAPTSGSERFHTSTSVRSGRAAFDADLRRWNSGVYSLGVRPASQQAWTFFQLQVS